MDLLAKDTASGCGVGIGIDRYTEEIWIFWGDAKNTSNTSNARRLLVPSVPHQNNNSSNCLLIFCQLQIINNSIIKLSGGYDVFAAADDHVRSTLIASLMESAAALSSSMQLNGIDDMTWLHRCCLFV